MSTATPNNIGGYRYSFVDKLEDRLLCKICHLPCRDPYLSVCCGHLFCKCCLDQKASENANNVCPVSHDEEFKTFPNKAIDREVRALQIYCNNKEKGCDWQGELSSINNHIGSNDGCQFEELKCSNECGKMIRRQYLPCHVEMLCPRRKVNCQYCHDIGEHQFITIDHNKECPKLPLPCPNKCEVGNVPREDLEAHRKECQLEIIYCANKCGKQFERRLSNSHMEIECLNRTVECPHCHTLGLHNEINDTQHRNLCPKLPLPCPNKCEFGSVPHEDMEAHRKECPLEVIQCEYHDLGCKVRIVRKDQKKHDNEKMKEHLMMTKCRLSEINDIQHQLMSTLLDTKDQLADVLKHITNLTVLVNSLLSQNTVPTKNIRSLLLDTSAMVFKFGSPLCPVIIKVSEFNRKKADKVEWYSDPFYTHNKGYKMCLRVDAAGHKKGEGTHLSVYLYVMKGSHDDEIIWPVKGNFKIQLLNQISDSLYYSMGLTYDHKTPVNRVTDSSKATDGQGSSRFIPNEDLYRANPTCQYLKDDCLFFQITKA